MDYYSDRVEIKYVLQADEMHHILEFIKRYGTRDKNSNSMGEYKISTCYIMSWNTRSRIGKNHGHLRIRHYLDTCKIFLEEKSKIQNLYYKTRYLINNDEEELLRSFDTIGQIENFINIRQFPFSPQLSMIPILNIFEISYIRQAYSVKYDDMEFRATIDRELLSNDCLLLPNHFILEIKTNKKEFDKIIYLFLQKYKILPQKFSKYKILKRNIHNITANSF